MSKKSRITELTETYFGGVPTPKRKTPPVVIAIDVGTDAVRAMAAEVHYNDDDSSTVNVIGAVSMPMDPGIAMAGIVRHSTRVASIISDCFVQLSPMIAKARPKQRGGYFKSIFTSVGDCNMIDVFATASRQFRPGYKIRTADLRDMEAECEQAALRDPQRQHIYGRPSKEFVINEQYITDNPIGEMAESLSATFHYIVGSEHMQTKLQDTINRVMGVALEHTFTKGEALGYALLPPEEEQHTCAIIDFGASTTSLHIYNDHKLVHTKIFGYGSNLITQDIAAYGILPSTAERLKKQGGRAMVSQVEKDCIFQLKRNSDRAVINIKLSELSFAIECRLDELFADIFQAIRDYQLPLTGKIYLAGAGCDLEGFREYIQHHTGIQTEYGSHREWFAPGTPEFYADPAYSQVLGTILLADEYLDAVKPQKEPAIKPPSRITQQVIKFFNYEGEKI